MSSSATVQAFAHVISMTSDSLSDKTVVVGLNAAFQKRFVLPSSTPLTPGSVHRADRIEEGVGGKGQDVAVSLAQLWTNPAKRPLCLAQFVGSGPGGDAVMSLLEDTFGKRGNSGGDTSWDSLTVRTRSSMRTCTSIVGFDSTTELVEPSGVIDEEEMKSLLRGIDALTSSSNGLEADAAALVIMGSMPPGCVEDTYSNLCSAISGDRTRILVDSVVGLKPLFTTLVAKRKSKSYNGECILKINASELCRLAGVTRLDRGETEGVTKEELNEAVQKFLTEYGTRSLDYMAITDGGHPAYLVKLGENLRMYDLGIMDLAIDNNDLVLYPIGAGDTVAAATMSGLLHLKDGPSVSPLDDDCSKFLIHFRNSIESDENDKDMLAAFAFGLACGSASCLEQENSVFKTTEALTLLDKMLKPNLC